METNNSCEELVAAEAGLESPKKPKVLSFIRISRKKGSLTTFVNYLCILFAITLLAIVSWEIWQMVRSEKLIKQIEIQNTHRNNERLLEDERFEDMVEQLNKIKNKLTKLEENDEKRDMIPQTTESPMETSIELGIPDIKQNFPYDWLKPLEEKNWSPGFMDSISNFPTFEVTKEDVLEQHDVIPQITESPMETSIQQEVSDIEQYFGEKSDNSIPVKIEETESGIHWIFKFNLGRNSGEDDTSEESNVNESKEMGAIPSVEKETSEEGWTSYIPRIISNPFKNTFGISWGWSSLTNEDVNQSSESTEEVDEKINSVEIQTVSTPVAPTINSSPKNYDDYNYDYDYDSEYETDYELTLDENSYTTPNEEIETSSSGLTTTETIVETQIPTTESIPTSTVQDIFEDVDESDDDTDDDYINFWNIFGDGADTIKENVEDGLKSTEVSLEESSSNEDDLLSESERIDRFFKDLLTKRIAEAALLQQQYPKILNSDLYYDYDNEEYYEDENANVTEQPSTSMDYEALENVTTESSLTSSVQEDLEEGEFATTEDPQVFAPLFDEKPLEFPALYYPGLKSTVDTLEESSKPDDFPPWLLPFTAYEEDEEYSDSDYVEGGWSYISKRSVDTPSAPEVTGEHLSAKEFEHKLTILRQAIDDENHFLQNEVSLTSEPTKQYLQSKLNNFYSKMERVSAHIDRLHERYLKLNKLDDDYVSRELPVE